MNKALPFRAHHGMCLQFFKGKGYSSDFTANMASVKNYLTDNDAKITVIDSNDLICSKCPNLTGGKCISADKVASYDSHVLSLCRIPSGAELSYSEYIKLVKEKVIDAGLRESVCGNCCWTDLCKTAK